MPFYGFKNKHTGKYITGTDYRCFPRRQIMNVCDPPVLVYDDDFFRGRLIESAIVLRGIKVKQYELVSLNVVGENKGCDCCTQHKPLLTGMAYDVFIAGGGLVVEHNGNMELMVNIKNCPMCGRELKGE